MISLLWNSFEGNINENNPDVESITSLKVFDDLRIRRILEHTFETIYDSDEIIEILKFIPNKDTIYYRQEIFEDILGIDIDKIYYQLTDIIYRYSLYNNATERIRKRYLLVFYNYNLFKFLDKIDNYIVDNNLTSKCFKSLGERIKLYFSKNKRLIDETNTLYLDLIKVLKITCVYHDKSPYVEIVNKESDNLEDKLIEISKKLNINIEDKITITTKKEINPYYLLEIMNTNTHLKDRLFSYYDTNYINVLDITKYAKELKFYVLVKELFERIKDKGIPLSKCLFNNKYTLFEEAYDISLVDADIKTIPNTFKISDDENIQFVLGVNSGGKTCYLRSIGINYYFALTTGYAFCKSGNIMILKHINTHFPNDENYKVGEGRLVDEVNRLKEIEKTFSSESLTLLNETFSSTSEDKACKLSYELIDKCKETKAKIVFVTHQYKIFEDMQDSKIGFYTPYVSEKEGNIRTYIIKKVDKKLLSYVKDILIKYGLTKEQLLIEKSKRDNHE